MIKTDLSGFVVTMHSGLCEQYVKSTGTWNKKKMTWLYVYIYKGRELYLRWFDTINAFLLK